jgi:putative transposase
VTLAGEILTPRRDRLPLPPPRRRQGGQNVDFFLTAKRDMAAAKRFFDKAMGANGDPDKVAIDKSGANKAAIEAINAWRELPILVR